MKHLQSKFQITYRLPAEIKANPRNARKHSDKQTNQIATSIKEFGFTNPVLIDENDILIAGHGRLEAALSLGLAEIPTIMIPSLTDIQKRALMLADNKLALNATWDLEVLAIELQELSTPALEIDVEITGFDTAEIDVLIGGPDTRDKPDPLDDFPEVDRLRPAVTNVGDIWDLGDHRILCGNALEADGYDRLLNGVQAEMVFTDPPYNVPIAGHVSGLGKVKHREFAMASGEMTKEAFTAFLGGGFGIISKFVIEGGILFICMDWRHIPEILAAANTASLELKNLCVWNKTNGGMGSLYRSQHELVFVFKSGAAPHINNVELGKHGRYRTNVWTYPGANTFRKGRKADLEAHPTVKPVALIADAIKDCSHRGGIILDPFGGSGSTLLAAERTGRRARLIELDPHYVDVALHRWQKLTGKYALLWETGQTLAEVATVRAAASTVGLSAAEDVRRPEIPPPAPLAA